MRGNLIVLRNQSFRVIAQSVAKLTRTQGRMFKYSLVFSLGLENAMFPCKSNDFPTRDDD
jgi:hypothetical protein